MKKVIMIMAVCLVASMTVFGQGQGRPERPANPERHGKCIDNGKAKEWMLQKKEQRRTYIVKQMGLTETETAAFNAIYDDYNKKISASKNQMNKATRALNDSLSDAEYEKNLDIIDAQRVEQAKITDEFYKAMKKALPIKKVYMYYKADKEFNKLMMKEMHQPKEMCKKKVEK